jgi:hypothetical protein
MLAERRLNHDCLKEHLSRAGVAKRLDVSIGRCSSSPKKAGSYRWRRRWDSSVKSAWLTHTQPTAHSGLVWRTGAAG